MKRRREKERKGGNEGRKRGEKEWKRGTGNGKKGEIREGKEIG